MKNVDITVNTKELKRLVIGTKHFEKEIAGAVASALNRTLDHVNTRLGKLVTSVYAIKTGDVKKTIKKYKAKKGDLSAGLKSVGHTLSLVHFPHKPETTVIARSLGVKHAKAQVKVKIKKGSMRQMNVSPKAFLQKSNGATNIFMRVGQERTPIVVLRTLSVPQMITSQSVGENIQKIAQDKMDERIKHEVDYRLSKLQKSVRG